MSLAHFKRHNSHEKEMNKKNQRGKHLKKEKLIEIRKNYLPINYENGSKITNFYSRN